MSRKLVFYTDVEHHTLFLYWFNMFFVCTSYILTRTLRLMHGFPSVVHHSVVWIECWNVGWEVPRNDANDPFRNESVIKMWV